MDNPVLRDIFRLEQIFEDDLALEKLVASDRLRDFIDYYTSRFFRNLKSIFKDYSHSEISEFGKKYRRTLDSVFKDPFLNISNLIIPTPKGMIGSYKETIISLTSVLNSIDARSLVQNTKDMTIGNYSGVSDIKASKRLFDENKKIIGGLFSGSSNLSHNLAEKVLTNVKETGEVFDMLLNLCDEYYPSVMTLENSINNLMKEKNSDTESTPDTTISPKDSLDLKNNLLDLAYRVSIFGIVMEHIQQIEHPFVKSVMLIREHAKKH